MNLSGLPLLLPDIIVDGYRVKGWELTVRTFAFEGKEPYLVVRYENPKRHSQYVFISRYEEDELRDYLKERKII